MPQKAPPRKKISLHPTKPKTPPSTKKKPPKPPPSTTALQAPPPSLPISPKPPSNPQSLHQRTHYHALILSTFRTSLLSHSSLPDSATLQQTIQAVKAHLYARDFAAAFGREDYLGAYAARWSPSRALAYWELFLGEEGLRGILVGGGKCGGGGEGVDSGEVEREECGVGDVKGDVDVGWLKIGSSLDAVKGAGVSVECPVPATSLTMTDTSTSTPPAIPGEGTDGLTELSPTANGDTELASISQGSIPAPGIASSSPTAQTSPVPRATNIVCLGGGAGAELVALAYAWEALSSFLSQDGRNIRRREEEEPTRSVQEAGQEEWLERKPSEAQCLPPLHLHLIDIAPWGGTLAILYSNLDIDISTPPTLSFPSSDPTTTATVTTASTKSPRPDPQTPACPITYTFTQTNIFSSSPVPSSSPNGPSPLGPAFLASADLVTLLFTLNELYATSLAQTTAFLLSLADALQPGARLLVVDSAGSYAGVGLGGSGGDGDGGAEEDESEGKSKEGRGGGKGAEGQAEADVERKRRRYPMQWLLRHTLLELSSSPAHNSDSDSTASPQANPKPKWQLLSGSDAQWFRHGKSPQSQPGQGADARHGQEQDAGDTYPLPLEDMRFQWWVYERV